MQRDIGEVISISAFILVREKVSECVDMWAAILKKSEQLKPLCVGQSNMTN